jgi:hypothetical protein
MDVILTLTPNGISKFLLRIIGCLLILNLISNYLKWVLGYNTGLGFVPLFDFDQEYNIPTFYSSLAILFSAALLWFIAKDNNKQTKEQSHYWKKLCFVFIFIGIDELTSIHNQFGRLAGLLTNITQIEQYLSPSRLWIVVYGPLLLIFFLYFIKFFVNLPKQIRNSFFMAGMIFIIGAIGLELLGDRYMFFHDKADIYYGLISTLEELFEMFGIVLFIRTLVYYIHTYSSKPEANVKIIFLPDKTSGIKNELKK